MNNYVLMFVFFRTCDVFVFFRTCLFVRALFVKKLSASIREARPETFGDVSAGSKHCSSRGGQALKYFYSARVDTTISRCFSVGLILLCTYIDPSHVRGGSFCLNIGCPVERLKWVTVPVRRILHFSYIYVRTIFIRSITYEKNLIGFHK